MIWTPKQREALVLVVGALAVALGWRLWMNQSRVPDPQPEEGGRTAELVQQIDPNEASWADLAALPVIGKSLAQRIVEERQTFQKVNAGQVAFQTLDDLLRVKGIGPVTLQAIQPHLKFPTTGPATRPSTAKKRPTK